MNLWFKEYILSSLFQQYVHLLKMIWKPLLTVAGLLIVPCFLVFGFCVSQFFSGLDGLKNVSDMEVFTLLSTTMKDRFIWLLLCGILIVLVTVYYQIICIVMIHGTNNGLYFDWHLLMKLALKSYLLPSVLAYLVMLFLIIMFILGSFFINVLLSLSQNPLFMFLGNLIFLTGLVFGILYSIRWTFVIHTVVLNKKRSIHALNFSTLLIRYNIGRVFGYILLFNIIIVFISQIIIIPFSLIIPMGIEEPSASSTDITSLSSVYGEVIRNFIIPWVDASWGNAVFYMLSTFISLFLSNIYLMLVYYDLASKKKISLPDFFVSNDFHSDTNDKGNDNQEEEHTKL